MKTLNVLLLAALSISSTAVAQTPPAPRNVSPNASEILLSMAQDSKRLRAEFRDIAQNHNALVPASELVKGTFKLKVDKDLSSVVSRKTKISILPSTAIDGFTLDPSSNFIAKLLQGDGGASGAAFYGFDSYNYPDVGTLAGMTAGAWRSSDAYTRPAAAIDRLISFCTTELADKNRQFWFEVLPLHLHCRTISLLNLQAFKATLGEDTQPDSAAVVPSYQTYTNTISALAIEFATGAAVLQAQKYVQSKSGDHVGTASAPTADEFVRNKARCFPVDSKPYIKTILGSFLMPFNQTASTSGATTSTIVKIKSPQSVAHPEPGYAIGTYARYNVNDSTHNLNIIANNFLNQDPQNPPAASSASAAIDYSTLISGYDATSNVPIPSIESSAIVIDNKTFESFTFNGEGVLHFNFNVRDIHGPSSSPSCTFYCGEPRRTAPRTFIDRVSTDITRDAWFRPGS